MNYNRFNDPKHIKWAKAVKKRDKYICQICGIKNVYLNSHHRNSWDIFKDQRFDINNGITLCQKHHAAFHNIYGHGSNTYYQFEEFRRMVSLIKEIAKEI